MNNYAFIALSLALFPIVRLLVLCTRADLTLTSQETDLFEVNKQAFLKQLDDLFGSYWLPPLALMLVSFLAVPWISWHALDSTFVLRNFMVFLAAIITWKGVTEDVDLATGKTLFPERLAAIFCLLGFFFYPGFLIFLLFIATYHFKAWYHHSQEIILVILQIFLAYVLSVIIVKIALLLIPGFIINTSIAAPLFLILCVVASFYSSAGIGKMMIGEHWYSWAWNNRSHYLAASAYMWGWRRKWE